MNFNQQPEGDFSFLWWSHLPISPWRRSFQTSRQKLFTFYGFQNIIVLWFSIKNLLVEWLSFIFCFCYIRTISLVKPNHFLILPNRINKYVIKIKPVMITKKIDSHALEFIQRAKLFFIEMILNFSKQWLYITYTGGFDTSTIDKNLSILPEGRISNTLRNPHLMTNLFVLLKSNQHVR